MSLRLQPFALLAALALPLLVAPAARPAAPPRPRTDLHGDPLPPGAVARLGTVKFRTPWPATTLSLSPDGRLLATGDDEEVTVWEVKTGRPLQSLRGPGREPHLTFSPDGKLAALATARGAVSLRELATGTEVVRLWGPGGGAPGVAFSPDGKLLAFSGKDAGRPVRVWDLRARKEGRPLRGDVGPPDHLAFSPDGKFLATAGHPGDGRVRLWDAASGRLLRACGERLANPRAVLFTPDGKRVVSVSSEGVKVVRVWEVKTGKQLRSLRLDTGVVTAAAVSPDGRTVATARIGPLTRSSVRVFDLATGRERHRFTAPGLYVRRLVFSADGKELAGRAYAVGGGGRVRVWDLVAGNDVHRAEGHEGRVLALAYSPDGKFLATAGVDATVRLWDPRTGRPLGLLFGRDRVFLALAFSPDGKRLATAGGFKDSPVRLWSVPGLKEVRSFGAEGYRPRQVLFTPDGKALVTGYGAEVRTWDARTGKLLLRFEPHGSGRLALSPDGKTLAAVGEAIALWDPATGKKRREFGSPGGYLGAVAFSPDGGLLATSSGEGGIRLWEVRTGRLVRQVSGGVDRGDLPRRGGSSYGGQPRLLARQALAFSPDGRTLASAFPSSSLKGDPTVRLWEVATGGQRRVLRGHRGPVHALAFSPDGRTLASASEDSTVLLWDVWPGARRSSRAPRPSPGWKRRLEESRKGSSW